MAIMTRLGRKHQLWVALRTLIVVFVLFSLPSCEEKVKPPVSTAFAGDIPTQESWNATITFTDSGKLTGILRAGHIAEFAEKRVTRLDSNIVVDFYDENQRHTSVLTARRGVVNDVNHDFEAHENVVVVSDSGSILRTQDLYWDNLARKIHTPAFVDLSSPTEQIQGQGFESDQTLKHYIFFKVTGQQKPND
ncbi:MAG TPA: LPS export ABC transporter periplasmic protein LptC [Bacteroidota bacterium]|nr:LPS export ABC transporter periplasmic protein LptC [Bacteroidota bacterium]